MGRVLDLQTKDPELESLHPRNARHITNAFPSVRSWGRQKTVRSQESPSLVTSVSTRFTEKYCLKIKVELSMVTDTFSLSTGEAEAGGSQFQAGLVYIARPGQPGLHRNLISTKT